MMLYINIILAIVTIAILFLKKNKIAKVSSTFWIKSVVLVSLLLLICAINLTTIGFISNSRNVSNQDILFILDLTQSMNAVDGRDGGENRRIENAKDDINQIVSNQAGAAFAIYGFDNKPKLLLPLTTNAQDVQDIVNTTNTQDYLGRIPGVAKQSDTIAEVKDYLKKQYDLDPTRERIVIFMSDFELYKNQENEDQAIQCMKELRNYAGGFINIVYGKDEGSKILKMTYDYVEGYYTPSYKLYPSASGNEDDKYLKDQGQGWNDALSKSNGKLSEKLASSVKGTSIRYTEKDNYKDALRKASKAASYKASSNPKSQATKQNWIYAPMALIALIWISLSELLKPKWLGEILSKSRNKK